MYLPTNNYLVSYNYFITYLTIFYHDIILYKHLVSSLMSTEIQKIKHQITFSISQNFKLLNKKKLQNKI